MSLELEIKQHIVQVLFTSFGIDENLDKIGLQPTRKGVEGDFTFVVFPYAGRAKMAPEALAANLGDQLVETIAGVSGYNVIKGFLNIELSGDAWLDKLKEVLDVADYGKNNSIDSKVMVEYSSPNTNKPLHLGHLRNNFLGFSIAQILKFNGAEVTMANLINDRGIHICKSMLAYQKFGNNETPESTGLKGDKLVGKYYVRYELEYQKEIRGLLENVRELFISLTPDQIQEILKFYDNIDGAESLMKYWPTSIEGLGTKEIIIKSLDEFIDNYKKDDLDDFYKFVRQIFHQFDDETKGEILRIIDVLSEGSIPLVKEVKQMLRDWEKGDKEVHALWSTMNQWVYDGFGVTYKSIGVEFDQYYYESNTYSLGKDLVQEGLDSGVFFKKEDGSVWADLEADGLDHKLVLRGDGTSVYMTQDMGTADLKYKDFSVDKSIYVVGNEQDYHFQVLKLIMSKLGRSYADGIYHMSYGMVDLPEGKMKSREGTVVDADDLIDEMVSTAKERTEELGKIDGFSEAEATELYHTLGLGAIKYFILKVDPKKRMLFNPKESIEFQGNTGPFIQYTHSRIKSLVRRAESEGVKASLEDSTIDLTAEQGTIALLTEFPKKVQEAGRLYSPAVIANFVFDLCKEFNKYYGEVPLFKEENEAFLPTRIAFCEAVAKVIKTSMSLLGINVPEKM